MKTLQLLPIAFLISVVSTATAPLTIRTNTKCSKIWTGRADRSCIDMKNPVLAAGTYTLRCATSGSIITSIYGYYTLTTIESFGFMCSDGSYSKLYGNTTNERFFQIDTSSGIKTFTSQMNKQNNFFLKFSVAGRTMNEASPNGTTQILKPMYGRTSFDPVPLTGGSVDIVRKSDLSLLVSSSMTSNSGLSQVTVRVVERGALRSVMFNNFEVTTTPIAHTTSKCSRPGAAQFDTSCIEIKPITTPGSYKARCLTSGSIITSIYGYFFDSRIDSFGFMCSDGSYSKVYGRSEGEVLFNIGTRTGIKTFTSYVLMQSSNYWLANFTMSGIASNESIPGGYVYPKRGLLGGYQLRGSIGDVKGVGISSNAISNSGFSQAEIRLDSSGGLRYVTLNNFEATTVPVVDKTSKCSRPSVTQFDKSCIDINPVMVPGNRAVECATSGSIITSIYGYYHDLRIDSLGFMCSDGSYSKMYGRSAAEILFYISTKSGIKTFTSYVQQASNWFANLTITGIASNETTPGGYVYPKPGLLGGYRLSGSIGNLKDVAVSSKVFSNSGFSRAEVRLDSSGGLRSVTFFALKTPENVDEEDC